MRRPTIGRRLPEARWQRALLAGLAVGAVVGAALGIARRDPSPEATVRAFFAARAGGDCDRLVGLISEGSWSRGGQFDREGFVAACAEDVDAYGPELADVTPLGRHGDRAAVAVAADDDLPVLGLDAADGLVVFDRNVPTARTTAMLVREDGGWKLETDDELLRVGRSPNDVLTAYMEARTAGACDDVADMLTEDAWAAAGADDRDGLVDLCRTRWGRPPPPGPGQPAPRLAFDVAEEGGRLTAVAESTVGDEQRTDTVTLVADGLGWKLDREPRAVAVAGLQSLVVDQPVEGFESSPMVNDIVLAGSGNDRQNVFDGIDGTPAERAAAGFRMGVVTQFRQDDDRVIDLLLYEFDTADGAASYAAAIAGSHAAALPASWPTHCATADPGCPTVRDALALDVDDRYVVLAEVHDDTDTPTPAATVLARAEEAVHRQLDQLG